MTGVMVAGAGADGMKRKMKTIACALTGIFTMLSVYANAAPTLCQPAEVNVFSCGAGKKVISVCAFKDASADHGYLQYRFGAPKQVEVAVPDDRSTPSSKSAIAGNLVFSGGGGAYLRFKTGEYEYVVYTAIGKGWGAKDGVAIDRNGKRRGHVACTDVPDSILGLDFFTRLGLRTEDPGDFDLP
jgi:hypothetical protein